jgi:hypothetical protein
MYAVLCQYNALNLTIANWPINNIYWAVVNELTSKRLIKAPREPTGTLLYVNIYSLAYSVSTDFSKNNYPTSDSEKTEKLTYDDR